MEQRWKSHFSPSPTLAVAVCRHTTPKEDDVRDPAEKKPGRKRRQARRKREKDRAEQKERGKGIKKTCLSKSSDGEKREKRRRD